MRILLAASAVLSSLCLNASPEEPDVKPPTIESVCDAMAPIILKGIAGNDTDAPIFHGNIDWHSAVHGHWALFRIARATDRHDEEARAADASMKPDLILKEIALLKDDALGELPYGFAWFLLLAEEFERWSAEKEGKDPKRLRAMADAAAAALVASYRRKAPSPLTREYDNASWAMVRLHRWFSFTEDKDGLALVNKWIAGMKGLEKPDNSFAFDRTHTDFFSRFGNFAYLTASTREPAELAAFLAARPVFDADIEPLVDTNDAAHHLGTNWSRAWALKSLASTTRDEVDRKRFRKAYEAHVVQGMKQHEASKDDFRAYGHWVPQFAVYAVTDGADEKAK
ncbi:MAG: hypothetical protein FD180_834 [Planctomycetota bacterium]|nr:MAG: hypothetical protein FD180_834 [Planctomycetota bacterium]